MNELTKEENLPVEEEAEVPAEDAYVEPEPVEEPEEPPVEVDETPDPSTLKAEVEELRKQREKAEQDALYWRRQKAEARADYFIGRDRGEQPPATPPAATPGIGPEPQEADFDDYSKFIDAKTDWKVAKARAEWDVELRSREFQDRQYERQITLREKLQRGYEKYSDFEEVALDRSATHITPMIADILADCEYPEDVAYHLAKNRVEGVKISRMTPIQAARAIAIIERDLTAEGKPVDKPKPTATNAPAPIKPVGSKEKVTKDPNKMSQKEYNAWREQQGARRF